MRTGSRETFRLALLGAVLPVFAILGCSTEPPARLNVIIILADTLRADHLGVYGSPVPTSPNIDALASQSVLFERNWAQAPCTFPSVNSLMTSRYPAEVVQDRNDGDFGIPRGIPTLAEMLRARGYVTHAISASPIVRATPSKMNLRGGFEAGFDTFDESCLWNDVRCVNERASRLLDALVPREVVWPAVPEARPFFLYLHYMDPHDPYTTPETHPGRFSGEYLGANEWARRGDPNPLAEMRYAGRDDLSWSDDDVLFLKGRYQDEIAYFDEGLQVFFDDLERRGVLDDTLLILLSDHGESFMEHEHVKHCYHLFEHNLHTPLIMRLPGASDGRRIATPSSNLDVVPTILDYVDERLRKDPGSRARGLSAHVRGRSLKNLIEGGEPETEPRVYASIGRYRAVTDGRLKLISDLQTGSTLLFDLERDPGEGRDLSFDRRSELHLLHQALDEWLLGFEAPDTTRVMEETGSRLRSLGYLQ